MKALIVYDSVFGNTEQVARAMTQAIGAGMDPAWEALAVKVDAVGSEHLEDVALLVVGSPTRVFRPTPALSSWVKSLPENSLQGVRVAAFDTRLPPENAPAPLRLLIKLFGWAAKPIANGLTKRGGELVAEPEGFLVTGTEGPLKEGELERAEAWAREIAAEH